MDSLSGIAIATSPLVPAPRPPTPAEEARRIVRHGMADVLRWLGEDVGPSPIEPVATAWLVDVRAYLFGPPARPAHPTVLTYWTGDAS